MKALLAFAAAATLFTGAAHAQPRDSRGIPVVSEPATPPPGVNNFPTIPPGIRVEYIQSTDVFATRPATMTYPPCERGQTDRCVQTYERGTRRPRR